MAVSLPSNGGLPSGSTHSPPLKASDGDLFWFAIDDTATADMAVFRSADGGSTWADKSQDWRPVSVLTIDNFSVRQDGDTVHVVVFIVSAGGIYLVHRPYDMSTESWGTAATIESNTSTGRVGSMNATVAVRPNGDIVVAYDGPSEKVHGTDFGRIYVSYDTGSGFSTPTGDTGAGLTDHQSPALGMQSDNDCPITYFDVTNNNVEGVVWRNTNAFSSRVSIDSDLHTSLTDQHSFAAVMIDGSTNRSLSLYEDNTGLDPYFARDDDSTAWATGQVHTSAPKQSSGVVLGCPIANDTDDLWHALWIDTDNDIQRDSTTSGTGAFSGSPTELVAGTTLNHVCGSWFVHSSGNGGATVIGYIYDDNGTWKYDEETLSGGSLTVSPALAQQLATATSPTLTPGAVSIGPPTLVQQLAAATAPTVAMNVGPTALAQQLATAFGPTLTPGAVTVSPALVQQLASAFDPALSLNVTPAIAVQLTTAHDPTSVDLRIAPAVVQQLATAHDPVVSILGGPQTISPALVQQLATALDPARLDLNVSAALVQQLVAATEPAALNLGIAPALVVNLAAAIDPTVTAGAVTVSPTLAQQLTIALDPTVTAGAVTVSPALVQQLATALDPAVSLAGALTIAPALAQQLAAAIDPTVTPGAVSISATLVQQLAAALDPTVTAGAVTLSPNLVQQLSTAIDPSVTTGAVTVSPALAQQLAAALEPVVTAGVGGTQTISPALVQRLAVALDPALSLTVAPALVQQLATAHDPARLDLHVAVALAQQLAAAFDPTLTGGTQPAWIVIEMGVAGATATEANRAHTSGAVSSTTRTTGSEHR